MAVIRDRAKNHVKGDRVVIRGYGSTLYKDRAMVRTFVDEPIGTIVRVYNDERGRIADVDFDNGEQWSSFTEEHFVRIARPRNKTK